MFLPYHVTAVMAPFQVPSPFFTALNGCCAKVIFSQAYVPFYRQGVRPAGISHISWTYPTTSRIPYPSLNICYMLPPSRISYPCGHTLPPVDIPYSLWTYPTRRIPCSLLLTFDGHLWRPVQTSPLKSTVMASSGSHRS